MQQGLRKLPIVRQHVEAMKCTVEIQSVPGRGATFRLRLPITLAVIKSLLFEAGLGYFNWDRYTGEDSDGLTARLALDFRYQIFKWLKFTERFNFYPTIGEGGDFWWRNEAALVAPLGSGWAFLLANILDFQSDPPVGVHKTDVQWIGALQYSF